MGLSGVSVGSLLIILLIVMVVFGTKRMRNIGEDLGAALRSFRQGMQDTHDDTSDNKDASMTAKKLKSDES